MDDTTEDKLPPPLPFNNLYLISGLVHGANKAWMYFFTLLFLICGYMLFQSIIFFPLIDLLKNNGFSESDIRENANLLFDANALRLDMNWVLLLELGMFVFAFIGFILGLRYLHHKSFTSVITGYTKFRFNRFWFGFSVWAGLIVVSIVLSYFLYPGELTLNFNLRGFVFSTLIMLFLMPIQTGIEEIIFRGYLIQGLSQVIKNGILPLLISSLLFGWAHMSNPEVKEFGWAIMLTYYVFFALFMGSLTLLDEGLELAFGIHFANNMISSMLITTPSSVIKTYSIFEAKTENPTNEIILWFVMATITFLIFWKKYRWTNFNLIIK